MEDYKQEFIEFAIAEHVLKFGEFTLKSGRVSPYFFNAGLFQTGSALYRLSNYYAKSIVNSGLAFDMLFGPAYKGIPLVSAIAVQLYQHYGLDYPYAYNRKEEKMHGEGGVTVGAELKGRVLIVDDVITAGTAIREVVDIIKPTSAHMAGVIVSLDRQEKGAGELSAIQEVQRDFNCPVINVAGFNDLIDFAKNNAFDTDLLDRILVYQARYGTQVS